MGMPYSVELNKLTLILFNLNMVIDKGLHLSCSLDLMHKHMGNGSVLSFLKKEYGEHLTFWDRVSEDADNSGFRDYFNIAMKTFDNVHVGSDFGISNNGILFLSSLVAELIQQGSAWTPTESIAGLQ